LYIKKALLVVVLVTVAAVAAQSPQPPLADSRLTVHTLVREDIFAGWMSDDMGRLERGEKNIQLLLEQRPGQKGNLLSWKGGALLYRAVLANEATAPMSFNDIIGRRLMRSLRPPRQPQGMKRWQRLSEAALHSSPTGCRRNIARPHGRRPMTITRRSTNSRGPLSTSSQCISAGRSSAASLSPLSAPAAKKKRRSTSTRFSPF